LFLITEPALVTVTSWLTTASTVFGLTPVVRALGNDEVGAGARVMGWQEKAISAPRTGSASRMRARRAGARAVWTTDTGRLLGGGAGPLAAAGPAAAGASDGAGGHPGRRRGGVPRGARAREGRGRANMTAAAGAQPVSVRARGGAGPSGRPGGPGRTLRWRAG